MRARPGVGKALDLLVKPEEVRRLVNPPWESRPQWTTSAAVRLASIFCWFGLAKVMTAPGESPFRHRPRVPNPGAAVHHEGKGAYTVVDGRK